MFKKFFLSFMFVCFSNMVCASDIIVHEKNVLTDGMSVIMKTGDNYVKLFWPNDRKSYIEKKVSDETNEIFLDDIKFTNEPLFDEINSIKSDIVSRVKVGETHAVNNEGYQKIYRELLALKILSWTVRPTYVNFKGLPEEITILYPENITVLGFKKLVYRKMLELMPNDPIVKSKLYNVSLSKWTKKEIGPISLVSDNQSVPNIDEIEKEQGPDNVQFYLKLEKSLLFMPNYSFSSMPDYRSSSIELKFQAPPCISIDATEVDLLLFKLTKNSKIGDQIIRIERIHPLLQGSPNAKTLGGADILSAQFVEAFDNTSKNQSLEPYDFFKISAAVWAKAMGKKITFQCEPLETTFDVTVVEAKSTPTEIKSTTVGAQKIQAPKSTQPPHWSKRWLSLNAWSNWFQSLNKKYVVPVVGTLTIGALYFFGSKHAKKSPTVPVNQ